ncbi:hypothetical protein E2C01_060473 [Portunus trituberculatus]|uniref:Uncharacterized protein n=1 Tax=Portunus trituberculatus TaxID=210409 RepID=A0A5B7H8T9_PORTR|nr:hypothetical protein [Portunus trituberculatus]
MVRVLRSRVIQSSSDAEIYHVNFQCVSSLFSPYIVRFSVTVQLSGQSFTDKRTWP